jgi:glycosyltransferase 2 family protein
METAQPRSRARPRHTFHRTHNHAFRLFAALALLGLSALPLEQDSITPLEADVFRFINGWPDALYPAMWVVMQFGNLLAVPASAAVAFATRRVRLGVDLLVAGGASWIFAKVVKAYVDRGRPAAFLDDVILRSAPAGGHGYVSGHAATAFALATVASPYLPRGWKIAVWSAAVIVCIARVYVGAHLPLDVIGGAAMGWGIGSLVHILLGAPHPGVHHEHEEAV